MAEDSSPEGLEHLVQFIKDARGFDFTGYKRSTLTRRIRKRMNEVQVTDYLDYRDLLETGPFRQTPITASTRCGRSRISRSPARPSRSTPTSSTDRKSVV